MSPASAAASSSAFSTASHPQSDASSSGAPAQAVPNDEGGLSSCWSCHHRLKRGGLVCRGCETVQPVDTTLNHFELLGMPNMSFDLDLTQLERNYKLLQWQLHPDKAVLRRMTERDFSAKQSTLVNMAYSVLREPLARANYLLMLHGINAGDNFEGTIEDPELLMEVLEAREQVEGTDDRAELQALLGHNRRQQAKVVSQLSRAFKSDQLDAAAKATTALTYLARLEEEILKKLPPA